MAMDKGKLVHVCGVCSMTGHTTEDSPMFSRGQYLKLISLAVSMTMVKIEARFLCRKNIIQDGEITLISNREYRTIKATSMRLVKLRYVP